MTILRDTAEGRILIFAGQEYYPQHFSVLTPGYRSAVEHKSHRCYKTHMGICLLSIHTPIYEDNIGNISMEYTKQIEMWHRTEVISKGISVANAGDKSEAKGQRDQ